MGKEMIGNRYCNEMSLDEALEIIANRISDLYENDNPYNYDELASYQVLQDWLIKAKERDALFEKYPSLSPYI